ncbi:MAG: radical SAM protein [Verrucomicrobiota bacterium]
MTAILETFAKPGLNLANSQLLKQTTSRCPQCKALCPAEVWKVGARPARVYLRRTCATHGEATVCISSDARFYWLSKGHPDNAKSSCCSGSNCCPAEGEGMGTLGRNAAGRAGEPFEKLSTCLALIEIVNSCNLSCPTCYADSPLGTREKVDAVPLENLKTRIQGVIDRKGGIEILQLSGGEPTLHPQFFELVEWAQNHPKIDYLLLNTNGVKIAADPVFAERLGKAFHYGGMQLYLQFDGVQEAGQRWLRGADLRATRQKAIEVCQQINLPLTLAMTVTPENLPCLWEAIEFGLKYPHIRGISFQPMFGNGRVPEGKVTTPNSGPVVSRLNTADIILSAVEQSHGKLRYDDFTPLPCGDPNCATIGYLLKVAGQVRSVSDFVNFSQVQGFLKDKIRYKLEDLLQCGCESEPLGDLLKKFELDERNTFRLFIKPFMDALDWDQDRIDRCCTHVIRPDGKLDSFCRYYSGFADTKASPQ